MAQAASAPFPARPAASGSLAGAFADLGPVGLVPDWKLEMVARELAARARRAAEFAAPGPRHDRALALHQLEVMRAILGPGEAE